jgi:hypothetical protein
MLVYDEGSRASIDPLLSSTHAAALAASAMARRRQQQREKSEFALGQSPEAVALMKTGP